MRVAVIGSGLAGMAAAEALVARGVRPLVIDIGEDFSPARQALMDRLAAMEPAAWSVDDRAALTENPSVAPGKKPRKLAFGSDHFYGRASHALQLTPDDAGPPPFSEAAGGLSVGWGASVLPPRGEDLADWPLSAEALLPFAARALEQAPYSARDDGLSARFPLVRAPGAALEPHEAQAQLLAMLARGLRHQSADDIVAGQSRLLTRARDDEKGRGCRACGACLSGCAYGAIHTAAHTLARLRALGAIDYERGFRVERLRDHAGGVHLEGINARGEAARLEVERVFVAAGALGSALLLWRSSQARGLASPATFRLLSTGGFLLPLVSPRRLPSAWPDIHTQAAAFVEFRARTLSPHWAHAQLSSPHELLYQLLGIPAQRPRLPQRILRRLLEHVVVAHVNFHSAHANAYTLTPRDEGARLLLQSRVEDRPAVRAAHRAYARRLVRFMASCGLYALPGLAAHGHRGASFHVGGSLPMRAVPRAPLETDLAGVPFGYERVHVVDSSVFPSLPGTTLGLLAMANAWRVASEVVLGRM